MGLIGRSKKKKRSYLSMSEFHILLFDIHWVGNNLEVEKCDNRENTRKDIKEKRRKRK